MTRLTRPTDEQLQEARFWVKHEVREAAKQDPECNATLTVRRRLRDSRFEGCWSPGRDEDEHVYLTRLLAWEIVLREMAGPWKQTHSTHS